MCASRAELGALQRPHTLSTDRASSLSQKQNPILHYQMALSVLASKLPLVNSALAGHLGVSGQHTTLTSSFRQLCEAGLSVMQTPVSDDSFDQSVPA